MGKELEKKNVGTLEYPAIQATVQFWTVILHYGDIITELQRY